MGHFQSTIKTTFSSPLRSGALRQWEPIFIGTKKDPTYDPRLTWEGRADKMVFVNLFLKKIYIYLSVSCCTLWDAILARYLALFQAIGSSMLDAFELCIGPFIYHVVRKSRGRMYFCQCPESTSTFTQIWLSLLSCRLKEWRCASESIYINISHTF